MLREDRTKILAGFILTAIGAFVTLLMVGGTMRDAPPVLGPLAILVMAAGVVLVGVTGAEGHPV